MLDKALQAKLRNYEPVVEPICSASVPPHANVIDSHTLYKVKVKDGETLQLKPRIVPHGNKDLYKELIRSDSELLKILPIILQWHLLPFFHLSYSSLMLRLPFCRVVQPGGQLCPSPVRCLYERQVVEVKGRCLWPH